MQAGDKIYTVEYGNHDPSFNVVTVTKITPKGTVEVEWASGTRSRFNKDGREIGEKGYFRRELDRVPFAERQALLAQLQRTKAASAAVKQVMVESSLNFRWGKEGMEKELARLQALL